MTVREHGDIKGILGINVQENGVTQVSSADTVNIVGGATVTDTGGVATINIPEGVTWYREDVPAGSASYTFVNAPATSTSFLIFTDSGTLLFSGVDYTYDTDTETVTFLSLGANEAAYIWVAHALVTGGNIGDMVKSVYDPNNVQQNVYDYTYFINTPTIGNATLTIQKNGSNVGTFGANATSNVTANITVPTTVAELSDASDYATTSDLSNYVTQSDLQTELGDYATTSDLSSKQDTLVSGTSIKTINSTSLLGSGDVTVQETLVSGTNIKTINNTSLLGSGDITISGGSGDVTGPASSTSGNLAVFDGTTGKIIKDGGAIPTGFNPGNTGTAGQFLKKTADGYEWDNDNDTTYSAGTGITITGTTIANSGVTSVNGQSGAVTISASGTNLYDAVVDAAGNGDYTTIGAAINAGKRSIYVKNGNYTESAGWDVSSTGTLNLVGESKYGVNVTIPNNATAASGSQFIKFGTGHDCTIKNMSFNISFTSTVKYFMYETESMGFLIDNCNFTYSSTYQGAIIFYMTGVISCTSRASGLDTFSNYPESGIYGCKFYTETPNTYRIFIARGDMYFERCLFQTGNSAGQIAFYGAGDRIFNQCTINAYTLYSKSDTLYTTYIEIFSGGGIEGGGSGVNGTDTVFYIEGMQDSRISLPGTMSLKPNRISLGAMINSEATMYTLSATVGGATFNGISNVINSHISSSNTITLNAGAYNSFFEGTVSCDVAVPFVGNRVPDGANFGSIGAIIMGNIFGNEFDVAGDNNIIVGNQMVGAIVDTGTGNVKANNINS